MADDDVDELKAKWLCYRCVGENYLSTEIQEKGGPAKCSYCDSHAEAYSIDDVASSIETAFEQHFIQQFDYDGDPEGEPVVEAIAEAASIPEEAAQDIQSLLEDRNYDHHAAKAGEPTAFSADSYYEVKGVTDAVWQEEWRHFERSLKTEARFFSRTATAHLSQIFGAIDKMSTTDDRPLVLDAGPGTSLAVLYRARVFQSTEKLKLALCYPDQQLGSPPMFDAAAGRMNARGISVFYGANEPGVALAEVRPPVGSQVAVARFGITRPLRLLDLTALSTVQERGSIFDSTFANRLERVAFLRSLTQRISRPVMPDDEAFEYLITQAIADFLATENEPALDGIVFPSVQASSTGLNVVLFHKAARVEAIEVSHGTEITADIRRQGTEDEEEPWYYSVEERVPPTTEPAVTTDDNTWPHLPLVFVGDNWYEHRADADLRKAALRLDLDSIKVHVVRRIQFECDEHDVSRRRWEDGKYAF